MVYRNAGNAVHVMQLYSACMLKQVKFLLTKIMLNKFYITKITRYNYYDDHIDG